jgi:pimeloyl-ACP methyl ester carboxylesterase
MSKIRPLFITFVLITMLISQTVFYHPQALAQDSRQRTAPFRTQAIESEVDVPQFGQDIRDTPDPSRCCSGKGTLAPQAGPRCGSSPFNPPKMNDATFVVDCGGSLDSGCTFRDGSPLVFTVQVTRVVGDVAKLKANGMISERATLQMPAFDVDFFGGGGQFNPERDRVTFNGNVVPGEFLIGDNNVWRLNEFSVPIEWVNFPSDPGPGGSVTPADNTIRIDIDTANSEFVWCTSIDWAAITIDVARPVVMAHGILSSGSTWSSTWVPNLNQLGLPNSNRLNMGNLDGIQDNAPKIAAEVANARQRWGVDKVNLVCHSKGGLDSRHYVENSDSVEQVIQLGTPNAGSPLADVVQGVVIGGLGILPALVINGLAGEAGYQLTQPYMAIYNFSHGSNPKVRYTALAGDYDPDCFALNPFCRPIDRLLLSIAGRGDTIVPVTSVHALPYTQNRTFNSSGDNGDAKHTSLTGSQGVYNSVRDRVVVFGTNNLTVQAATPPTVAQTGSVVGSIQQGQVQTRTIPIDQTTPAYFSMLYPSGDLDLALISPSGQRFDASTIVGNPNVTRDEQDILGGRMEAFYFNSPEVGNWTVEVRAPLVTDPSGAASYAVMGWLENPAITFTGAVADSSLNPGQTLQVLGTLKNNNAPLTGATVTAKIALPDNTTQTITLQDTGTTGDATANDGVYTGNFTGTTQPGTYRLVMNASRATAPAFTRETFTLATVSRSTSTITGPFQDFGRDTDGDTFFNQLVIRVGVNITATANYHLFGVLEDAQGNTLTASTDVNLNPGANNIELKFDGETIFNNRVDGPYRLKTLRLAEEDDASLALVDERTDAHQTAAYSFRVFQHSRLNLTGTGTSVGVDTNGNGRFDLLNVGINVEVVNGGFYQWSARLTDSNGTEIGFAAGSRTFAAGTNTMTFSFDGEQIGQNGVNGPYFVRGLLLFGGGDSLVVSNAFTTDAFLASQFEGFVADTTPPTLMLSVSPTTLWPVSHNLVLITASITVQDDVDQNPSVELLSITANEPINGRGDGNTEGDIEGADFGTDDREFFLRAERSGTGSGRIYTITYRARDAAGNTTVASATVIVPHNHN